MFQSVIYRHIPTYRAAQHFWTQKPRGGGGVVGGLILCIFKTHCVFGLWVEERLGATFVQTIDLDFLQ